MASGTRSKADSDIKQKIAEFRDIAAVLYMDEVEQREYVRARLEALEREAKERDREEKEQASAPADIASAANRYLTARKDIKGKASDKPEDKLTDKPTSSRQPTPTNQPTSPAKPQHHKALIQRPVLHNSYNRQSHPPRHSQTNNHHRDWNARVTTDLINSSRPHITLSAMTELPEPSAPSQSSQLDEEEEDYYVISALSPTGTTSPHLISLWGRDLSG
ncbi:UBX domain-containing protein 1-A [Biomphalaria pfeifferi]|uniref:UBX domain-containing protein 1-A n=1 Tax=Biomphalaria pfeifferi TaxID=112525 RepID=A0AAD8F3M4_BIOPF|nr:UBX domain-containing protein 1-A [Biomphalaria pfeifferi]